MLRARFEELIKSHKAILFMKGRATFSPCGLSSKVCFLLKKIKLDFEPVDLSNDPELLIFLREKHSPAVIPYLYMDEKFVGGYDEIMAILEKEGFRDFLPKNFSFGVPPIAEFHHR